jgi:hypothetical protein
MRFLHLLDSKRGIFFVHVFCEQASNSFVNCRTCSCSCMPSYYELVQLYNWYHGTSLVPCYIQVPAELSGTQAQQHKRSEQTHSLVLRVVHHVSNNTKYNSKTQTTNQPNKQTIHSPARILCRQLDPNKTMHRNTLPQVKDKHNFSRSAQAPPSPRAFPSMPHVQPDATETIGTAAVVDLSSDDVHPTPTTTTISLVDPRNGTMRAWNVKPN